MPVQQSEDSVGGLTIYTFLKINVCITSKYYEQQAYDQNYYNMCQDYIQKQRQLQYESLTMTQPGYSAVMDYVDKIGDNLKTPKVLNSALNSAF